MEQNSLQPDHASTSITRPLTVAILGFEAIDEESFSRFFQVARPYQRKYAVADLNNMASSDIVMVNYDNASALAERDAILLENPGLTVVAVSRGPLNDPPVHHIRGMLFAARVLNVLDKVSIAEPVVETVAILDQPEARASLIDIETPSAPVVDLTPIVPVAEPTIAPVVVAPELIVTKQPETQVELKAEAETKSPVEPQAEITAQPAPTEGVTQAAPASSTTTPISPIETAEEPSADGYCALVVDDSVAIQKSLEINLATLPQINTIDFADSGESALEKADARQYDLIFLDVMMPGIDGYETCTRLRKKPEYKKTPIIMVSGKTSPLDEVKGVMAGCTTYLTKPVQQEAFQKLSIRVLSWLEKQKKP